MKLDLIRVALLALVLAPAAQARPDEKPASPPPDALEYGKKEFDARFLKMAFSGNLLEIKLSEYAVEQLTKHDDLEKLATMLIQHHTEAKQKVKKVAEQCGVELSEELLPAHQAALDLAKEVKGETYHVPYLFNLASSHVMGILAVSHHGHYTKNPAVKAYCDAALPMLKSHFAQIKPLAEDEAKVTDMMK